MVLLMICFDGIASSNPLEVTLSHSTCNCLPLHKASLYSSVHQQLCKLFHHTSLASINPYWLPLFDGCDISRHIVVGLRRCPCVGHGRTISFLATYEFFGDPSNPSSFRHWAGMKKNCIFWGCERSQTRCCTLKRGNHMQILTINVVKFLNLSATSDQTIINQTNLLILFFISFHPLECINSKEPVLNISVLVIQLWLLDVFIIPMEQAELIPSIHLLITSYHALFHSEIALSMTLRSGREHLFYNLFHISIVRITMRLAAENICYATVFLFAFIPFQCFRCL